MPVDINNHPCFSKDASSKFGRVHLPVAPKCNIQCKFCNRKFDCINESRPGVSSTVLTPPQALYYLKKVVEEDPRVSVVGIAGPGDPFANADLTMETLRLVRKDFPEMILCVATNGMNLLPYVEELAELDVSHVTITINAVDPEIGQNIYSWMRDGTKVLRNRAGADALLKKQLDAIVALKKHNIIVKINSIVIPGVNDHHILDITKKVKELGADLQNCMSLLPVKGTPFENIESPSHETIGALRFKAGAIIKQMMHCGRCRADAVGKIGEKMSQVMLDYLHEAAQKPINPDEHRPYYAVASMEGLLVNMHLGEARELSIFELVDGEVKFIETRKTPGPGSGDLRWKELAAIVGDCNSLLASGAGPTPRFVLEQSGVKTLVYEGLIEDAVKALDSGEVVRFPEKGFVCGSGCQGDGNGCG